MLENFADSGHQAGCESSAVRSAGAADREVTVLLADDHALLRESLRQTLEREADIKVIAEADNGLDAVRLARELKPDVVAMDIRMPGIDGISATRALLAEMPDAKVLALSAHADRHFVLQMLGAGARGYVVKTSGIGAVVAGVRAVFRGRTYLCRDADAAMAEPVRRHGGFSNGDSLAQRETQVLALLAEGRTSQAIGEKLSIARGTVDVHRRNIMRKLGLHTIPELTQYAVRKGLISL
jgi:DNA-binding NarL/FixJ family response regulator